MQTFKLSVDYALVYQLGLNQRLSKFFKQMGNLENLFVECFSSEILDNDAPINFIQKTEMKACDRFADMNFETQHHPLEILDEFVREELGDCEAFNEALA